MASLLFRREEHVTAAVAHLQGVDRRLKWLIERAGPFTLKVNRDRYGMLVRSILSQQISTKAARAIRLKLEAAVGELTPDAIAAASDPTLRAAGLSAQKVTYLRDLTQHVHDGRLALAKIHRCDDEAVIQQLIAVKGIGRWTAQMFLMFSLGRLDVFPHDDLGIRSSIRELYGLSELPTKAQSLEIAAPWRPYSTIASWYVWRLSDLKSDPTMDASQYPV